MGVTLVYCAWDYAIWLEYPVFFDTDEDASGVWIAVVTALPLLAVAPLAAYLRTRSARVDFWRRLEQLALAYAVGGASLGTIVASAGGFDDGSSAQIEAVTQMVRTLMALAAGAAVAVLQPGVSGRMAGAIIAGSGLTLALSVGASGYEVFAAMLFMALWAGIAAASLLAGWRGVFQLAVGAIALRLIVLSFELASDLLLSGFGLIVSGVLILAIAWVAYKVSQAYAPSDEQGVQ